MAATYTPLLNRCDGPIREKSDWTFFLDWCSLIKKTCVRKNAMFYRVTHKMCMN